MRLKVIFLGKTLIPLVFEMPMKNNYNIVLTRDDVLTATALAICSCGLVGKQSRRTQQSYF